VEALLAQLSGQFAIEQSVAVAILVIARVIPITLLTSWIALRATPNLGLLAVSALVAILLTPYALATAPALSTDTPLLLLLVAREILIGTVFAIAVALPFFALAWAGRLTDTLRDPSLGTNSILSSQSSQTPLRNLYVLTGMVLFFSIGGHRLAITALTESFVAIPIGSSNQAAFVPTLTWESVRLVASALTLSLLLAAPVAAMIALSEFAFGIVDRSLPNLSLYLVAGIPLRALVILLGALFSIAIIIDMLPQLFREAIEGAGALLKRLAP
jgi:flagellar biosynthesis protein FliR